MLPPEIPADQLAWLLALMFGLAWGYDQLIDFAQNQIRQWSVLISVILGVAWTLLIPLFFFGMEIYKYTLFYSLCFVASGVPMAAGHLIRSAKEQRNHKRKAVPQWARRVAGSAALELDLLAGEVNQQVVDKTVDASILVRVVRTVDEVKGMLRDLEV